MGRPNAEAEQRARRFFNSLFDSTGLVFNPELKGPDHMFSQGSALFALVADFEARHDPAVRARIEHMIAALDRVAVQERDYLWFPQVATKVAPCSHMAAYQVYPIVHFHELTGHTPALRYAERLSRWALYHDPTVRSDGVITKPGWEGHLHAWMDTYSEILRCSRARGSRLDRAEVRDRTRLLFEWVLANYTSPFGWVADSVGSKTCETDTITSAIRLALELIAEGHAEYRRLIEPFVRNQLVENQFHEVDRLKLTDDRLARGIAGCFESYADPNTLLAVRNADIEGCCINGGVRGLYLAWQNAIQDTPEVVRVNLLLTAQSPSLAVVSHLPYKGQVNLHPVTAKPIRVALPEWLPPGSVEIDGAVGLRVETTHRSVRLANVQPGSAIKIRFPQPESQGTYVVAGRTFRARWLGDTVTELLPFGGRIRSTSDCSRMITGPGNSLLRRAAPRRSRLFAGACLLVVSTIFLPALKAQGASQEEQQFLLSVVPLIERNDLAMAERQLIQGLGRYPHSAILENAVGIVYEKEKRPEEAISAYERAVHELPSFTAAQLHLASLYQQRGREKGAADLFAAAGEGSTNSEAISAAGLGLAECEDYARAIRLFEKADRIAPGSPSIAYNLALALYRNGEYERALHIFDSPALAGERDAPDFLYLRAKVHEGLGQPATDELVAACRHHTALKSCLDAALSLIKEEKFESAGELLEGKPQEGHPSAPLLTVLGLTQFRLGRYQEAIRTYERAMSAEPDLYAAREGLGFLYYVTGDLDKARAIVEAGLTKPNPQFYLWQLDAMIIYRQSPRLCAKAEAAVNRALETNPRFAPAYFLRGKIKMEENSLESALADFRHATELDPKYALPWYKMAQIYRRQGRTKEGEEAVKRFSELGSLREDEVLARQTQDVLMPGVH
ncbi:MAG: tetratricopeptide repeat protein [Bryobacteraceae bacterium]